MDSFSAFEKGAQARRAGNKSKMFDWDKAATIIEDRGLSDASAGLSTDLEWTEGTILRDGERVNGGAYLASNWATPVLVVDGVETPCWKWVPEDFDGDPANGDWPK
jgi:hypothetical protein